MQLPFLRRKGFSTGNQSKCSKPCLNLVICRKKCSDGSWTCRECFKEWIQSVYKTEKKDSPPENFCLSLQLLRSNESCTTPRAGCQMKQYGEFTSRFSFQSKANQTITTLYSTNHPHFSCCQNKQAEKRYITAKWRGSNLIKIGLNQACICRWEGIFIAALSSLT